jgi:DUF971 family protein
VRFDDMHDSGFYTWEWLHELGVHKWARSREYLSALRAQGLSRDPRRSAPTMGRPHTVAG